MRTQLVAALEESLAATPDPTDVLVGIRSGIRRRQRRNRYYRTGFAITALTLMLIASLAAATVTVSAPDRTPAGIPVGEWKNTIRPTWLPDGLTAQEFTATADRERIFYHATEFTLEIVVDQADLSGTIELPPFERIEINGRPAGEWSIPGQSMLLFALPSGRWAQITLSRSRPTADEAQPPVRDDALHVARSLRETGDLRLRTRFAPLYLPTGQRIIGVETNLFTPPGFGTIVCAVGRLTEGLGVRISMTNVAVNKDLDRTARIADIQHRPAYRSVSNTAVYVAGFHGGTLTIDATVDGHLVFPEDPPAATVPLDELIKIAESVRWVG